MRTLKGLDDSIKDLDGNPLTSPDGKAVTAKSIIANVIATGSSEEPARAMSLAVDIYKADGELEVEDADFALVEQAVKGSQLNNMAKAMAMGVLESE